MKSVLNFINNYSERMNVSNVNISSDEGSKALQCTMTVQMFSVGGQAKEYKDLTSQRQYFSVNRLRSGLDDESGRIGVIVRR